MITKELIAYIKTLQAQGAARSIIEKNLLSGGWNAADIKEGFDSLNPPPLSSPLSSPVASPVSSALNSPAASPMGSPIATKPLSAPATSPLTSPVAASPIIINPNPTLIRSNPVGINPNPSFVSFAPTGAAAPRTIVTAKPRKKISLAAVIVLLLALIIAGGTAYAYTKKIGPFAVNAQYTEENLFSGILTKSATINTSAYSLSASLAVGPRDLGAEPFRVDVSTDEKVLKQYENDAKRGTDAQGILNALKYNLNNKYPATLSKVKDSISYTSFSITDPLGSPYSYALTDDGKNFTLKVTFETGDAVSSIRKGYNYKKETTPINGKTVTFTNESDTFFYLANKPPEPFLVELGKLAKNLPGEFKMDATVGAQTDFSVGNLADWTFNVDANGDFGDLQYKFNIDALKKGSDYYFKINNIPSLFLGAFSNIKGSWVKVTPKEKEKKDDGSGYFYDPLSSIGEEISKSEESYKENRAELTELLKKASQFADEEKLISFKNKPTKEKVGELSLYRYDLQVNRAGLIPFYQRLVDEAQKTAHFKSLFEDSGLVEYLQSKEFDQVFDYYQKNVSMTVWVDSLGFAEVFEYRIRLIPSDEATQLKDKQGNLVFTLKIKDINKPVNIEAPKDAKDLEDVIGPELKNARAKGSNAAIKANLANMRASAEIYYDEHSSYGSVGTKGSCATAGSIFSDKSMSGAIKSVEDTVKDRGVEGKVVCYSNSKAWATSAPLIEVDDQKGFWCVDSTGASKQVKTAITSTICK